MRKQKAAGKLAGFRKARRADEDDDDVVDVDDLSVAELLEALKERVGTQKRKDKPMQVYKATDVPQVCKGIADQGSTSISESEVTALITAYAKHAYPDARPDVAFAKVFTANDDVGIAFRRAVQIAKGLALVMPVYVGGDAALAVDDPEDALAQLEELAEEQRRRAPEMSKSQAFAKVFSDPANRALAAAERRQNRPRA